MYSSDITEKEWLILAPFIAQGKMGRPRTHDNGDYYLKNFRLGRQSMIITYVGVRTVNGKRFMMRW